MCDHCRAIEAIGKSLADLKHDPVFLAESPGLVLFGEVLVAVATYSKRQAGPAREMIEQSGTSPETRTDAAMFAKQLIGAANRVGAVLIQAKQTMGDQDGQAVVVEGGLGNLGGLAAALGKLLGAEVESIEVQEADDERATPDFMEQLRRDIERAEGMKRRDPGVS